MTPRLFSRDEAEAMLPQIAPLLWKARELKKEHGEWQGKLIALHKKLQAVGGRLILCNIDAEIFEVFEITRLDKFFNIQKEEQTALQAF